MKGDLKLQLSKLITKTNSVHYIFTIFWEKTNEKPKLSHQLCYNIFSLNNFLLLNSSSNYLMYLCKAQFCFKYKTQIVFNWKKKLSLRLNWWGDWAEDEHDHINTVIMLIYFSLNSEHPLCLLWIFTEWITTKNILKSTHLQGAQALLPALLLVHPPLLWEPQKSRMRELTIQVKQFTLCSCIFYFKTEVFMS